MATITADIHDSGECLVFSLHGSDKKVFVEYQDKIIFELAKRLGIEFPLETELFLLEFYGR